MGGPPSKSTLIQDQTDNPRIWMEKNDKQWTPIDGAPMVRCSVRHRYDDRCNDPAVWGEISWLDDTNYRLTAFCTFHWEMHTNTPPPVYDIRINGRAYHIPARAINYRTVVALAHGEAEADGPRCYTVVYCNGPANNIEGSLLPGQAAVRLGDGMDFEAMVTGRA